MWKFVKRMVRIGAIYFLVSSPYSSPPQAAGGYEAYTVHTDHLGSTRLVTDSTGTVKARLAYFPFGVEVPPVKASPSSHRFAGHERDLESDLDYMFTRYYSANLGRFLTPDPLSTPNVWMPQGWNKYAYVTSNPLRYIDPDGRAYKEDHGRIIEAAGGDGDLAQRVMEMDEGFRHAATNPRGHFGKIEKAQSLLDRAKAAREAGDEKKAKKLERRALHLGADVIFHRDSKGNPIGWWGHLFRWLADVFVRGRPFNPDSPERPDYEDKFEEAVEWTRGCLGVLKFPSFLPSKTDADIMGRGEEQLTDAVAALNEPPEPTKFAGPALVSFPYGLSFRVDGADISNPYGPGLCGPRRCF